MTIMHSKVGFCVEKAESHHKTSERKTAYHLRKQSKLKSAYLQDQKHERTIPQSKKNAGEKKQLL